MTSPATFNAPSPDAVKFLLGIIKKLSVAGELGPLVSDPRSGVIVKPDSTKSPVLVLPLITMIGVRPDTSLYGM